MDAKKQKGNFWTWLFKGEPTEDVPRVSKKVENPSITKELREKKPEVPSRSLESDIQSKTSSSAKQSNQHVLLRKNSASSALAAFDALKEVRSQLEEEMSSLPNESGVENVNNNELSKLEDDSPNGTRKRPGPKLIKPLNKKKGKIVIGSMKFDPVHNVWIGNEEELKIFNRKTPALISNINSVKRHSGFPKTGEMIWDQENQKWLGNEQDLSSFPSANKPKLYDPVNFTKTSKSLNGMVLDEKSMVWKGNDEVLDLFDDIEALVDSVPLKDPKEFELTEEMINSFRQCQIEHEKKIRGWIFKKNLKKDPDFDRLTAIRTMSIMRILQQAKQASIPSTSSNSNSNSNSSNNYMVSSIGNQESEKKTADTVESSNKKSLDKAIAHGTLPRNPENPPDSNEKASPKNPQRKEAKVEPEEEDFSDIAENSDFKSRVERGLALRRSLSRAGSVSALDTLSSIGEDSEYDSDQEEDHDRDMRQDEGTMKQRGKETWREEEEDDDHDDHDRERKNSRSGSDAEKEDWSDLISEDVDFAFRLKHRKQDQQTTENSFGENGQNNDNNMQSQDQAEEKERERENNEGFLWEEEEKEKEMEKKENQGEVLASKSSKSTTTTSNLNNNNNNNSRSFPSSNNTTSDPSRKIRSLNRAGPVSRWSEEDTEETWDDIEVPSDGIKLVTRTGPSLRKPPAEQEEDMSADIELPQGKPLVLRVNSQSLSVGPSEKEDHHLKLTEHDVWEDFELPKDFQFRLLKKTDHQRPSQQTRNDNDDDDDDDDVDEIVLKNNLV